MVMRQAIVRRQFMTSGLHECVGPGTISAQIDVALVRHRRNPGDWATLITTKQARLQSPTDRAMPPRQAGYEKQAVQQRSFSATL
jgi:hypothetical protein